MTPARAEGALREIPAAIGGAGITAALVLVAMLIAFGWSNWPSADDFCNTVLVKNGGVSGAMRWLYTQWSGRVFTGIVMYTVFALVDIPALHVVSVALAAMFALAAWQMARFVGRGEASAPLWAFMLAALTLGAYPLLGQAVFWPTGGMVYLVPLVLLLHWLTGMRRLVDGEMIAPANGYWFLVSAALGNSIELVVPIAVAYLVIGVFPHWRRMMALARRALLVRTAGLLTGVVVLVTAPGNYLRGDATPGSFALNPGLLLHEYGRIVGTTLQTGALLAALVFVIACATGLVALASRKHSVTARARTAEAVALALGGFGSLVPVLAAPAQFAPRNGLYLLVGLLLAGMLLLVPQLQRGARAHIIGMGALAALGFAGAVLGAHRFAGDDELAGMRRTKHLVRHELLRDPAHRGTSMVVDPIRPYPPQTLHAIDITANSADTFNQCVARYYDLAAVRLASPTK